MTFYIEKKEQIEEKIQPHSTINTKTSIIEESDFEDIGIFINNFHRLLECFSPKNHIKKELCSVLFYEVKPTFITRIFNIPLSTAKDYSSSNLKISKNANLELLKNKSKNEEEQTPPNLQYFKDIIDTILPTSSGRNFRILEGTRENLYKQNVEACNSYTITEILKPFSSDYFMKLLHHFRIHTYSHLKLCKKCQTFDELMSKKKLTKKKKRNSRSRKSIKKIFQFKKKHY